MQHRIAGDFQQVRHNPVSKMLKRILMAISSMGVKNIVLINSYRVEKSFWKSPALDEDRLRDYLLLGLEQAGDTMLPTITQKRLFKPFVEDELPDMIHGTWPLVAHPIASDVCPTNVSRPITLAIGPEGGFIPYEVDKLVECSFTPIHPSLRNAPAAVQAAAEQVLAAHSAHSDIQGVLPVSFEPNLGVRQ